ncbi:MAG: NYN domain-containing protein [Deltaproteobacteria bacterium]|nr:NYN domain-containing protein [Deltaproteobacteria bacterium]
MHHKPKTYVYVDAFNLYYGAIKGTKFHWLNLDTFCKKILPQHEVTRIKYFTALVKPRPNDLQEPLRQQLYLRALKTIPNLDIIYGHYLSHTVTMPMADFKDGKIKYARVIKTEEKGSDVNLATHLLHDAHLNKYESAVVVTNDSDLVEPIRIIVNELKKNVGVINPQKHPSNELLKVATFFKSVRHNTLAASQFPSEMKDNVGLFHVPEKWK